MVSDVNGLLKINNIATRKNNKGMEYIIIINNWVGLLGVDEAYYNTSLHFAYETFLFEEIIRYSVAVQRLVDPVAR